jgi:hypothetical protein
MPSAESFTMGILFVLAEMSASRVFTVLFAARHFSLHGSSLSGGSISAVAGVVNFFLQKGHSTSTSTSTSILLTFFRNPFLWLPY